jgi:aminoglycoside phosphotransferase (APT) family kinase protein
VTPGTTRLLQAARRTLATIIAPELRSEFAAKTLVHIDCVLEELIYREVGGGPSLVGTIVDGRRLIDIGKKLLIALEVPRMPRDSAHGELQHERVHADLRYTRLAAHYDEIAAQIEDYVFVLDKMKSHPAGFTDRIETYLALAAEWEAAFFSSRTAWIGANPAAAPPDAHDPPTGNFQKCLRQNGVLHVGERVSAIDRIAGGYSKSTFIVHINDASGARRRLVIRRSERQPLLTDACFCLQNEFEVLNVLHSNGVRIPRPIAYDSTTETLGGNIIVMEFARGAIHGTAVEHQSVLPESTFAELAGELARLHQIPLETVAAIAAPIFGAEALHQSIAQRNLVMQHQNLTYWLERRREFSPIAARAFGWLIGNVPKNDSRPALIHGDLGLHNVLFIENRLSAILDWESAQIGDPAQDLSSVRELVAAHMEWSRFLDLYYEAGGLKVDETSLRYHALSRNLRSLCIIAAAGAMFECEKFDDIKAAALKIAFLPFFVARTDTFCDELSRLP